MKLDTGIEIKYDKKGNIKKLKSPYDNPVTNRKIDDPLINLFKGFNDIYSPNKL